MWETLLVANPRRIARKRNRTSFWFPDFKSAAAHRRRRKGSHKVERSGSGFLVSGGGADFSIFGGKKKRKRRNQNLITDAFASQIASQVATRLGKSFSRASPKRKKAAKKHRRNPHLAIIGANPHKEKKMARRRRRRNMPKRNAKGRFVKANAAKRRRNRATPKRRRRNKKVVIVNSSRRRRRTRATPRRRRSNKARVIIKYKYRNRKRRSNPMARRRRKSTHRRRRHNRATPVRRRRNRKYTRASNPRRRRSSRRSYRRRRNAGLGGLVGRVNFMQVAEVAGGVFVGDKLTSYLSNMVAGYIGITDPSTLGFLKLGVGIVSAGVIWKFRPALGLGVAVGAANSLLNQYVFQPLWGYATPYLPTGMAGLGEYKTQGWKLDPWIAGAGNTAVAGLGSMGNKLLNKGL